MEEHIIFEKIDLIQKIIKEKDVKKILTSEDLSFYQTAIDYIKEKLNNTIPSLVQESDLTNASNEIESAVSQLNTYVGNENTGHLKNSKNSIISASNRIKNLPTLIQDSKFNFSSEIINFKNSVSEKNSEFDEELENLKGQLSSLDDEITDRMTELNSVKEELSEKQKEIEKLNTSFEEQYESDRTKYLEKLEEQENSIKSNTDNLVQYLEKKKTEASKIVNVIGNIGATGNFQKIANDHKKDANLWRFIAILFMAGLSGLIIWAIIGLGDSEFDWTKSLIRIIAAAALSYPATYASRESSKHRKLENFNRKLELELASIESFIEILPEEKKQGIKEKLAEKYFGSTLDQFEDADLKSDKDFSLQSIERLFKAVKSLKE
ncbi:hypothetical protein SAMN04489761_1054 [Tenacibaculum sp. MAR_2009_124]|uniref:hypothetical protein n=1 Tax=Tenacibaculum sp. MAR_2009_124 TaxID=1250059 RepID=UPI0008961EB5|nr:hypothetical protein [Tenacibaculum sp. MAR_2009_124]SEB49789.1 hypothetical protein SAMN04489761_1054 [Tenacibaculum sp. MAR_2009_124]